ncbi:PEP/pyruvate-binding domain-containing protein [Actinoplanes regularis]|uniref:PEP/pyruvate-binding domain-containing protein n=1 Tax=Actinoplanes regularis TaxID=52697 RepID=UPI0024A0DFEA|nr:PEP/pyruvate-binding domain-containing protein [Actinoplanes regularis]GLW35895.1 phosphoenolpyruvate synthase [Actinoplanes regularis]
MLVVPLAHAASIALAGGKAAALGELIRAGETVPDGFVVTTEAFRAGVVPRDAVAGLFQAMGPVAVRSSATAEDLPDASFSGQYDTFLDVTGIDQLIAAIEKCWASVRSPRAVAYRATRGLPEPEMAVIVQRMITATTAGVLFTANPVTGNRTEMLVESTAGPGTGVVDGTAPVDRFSPAEGTPLRALGERLQQHFAAPQDVEWAIDDDRKLWLLQSRPITTLFPAPPRHDGPLPRVYVEFGHVQGMLRPVTPMGLSSLKRLISAMTASLGVRAEIVDIGGRLYGDLSDLARHPSARKRLVKLMAVDFGPRAQAVMDHVLTDPRFAPTPAGPRTERSKSALGTGFRAVTGILRALRSPEAARQRVLHAVERLRLDAAAPAGLNTAHERIAFVRADGPGGSADDLTWPIVAGLLATAVPGELLKGVATPDEIHTALGGVPGNVTIEMDLALWRLARDAAAHRELLLATPPADLAELYLRGGLPPIGLDGFLERYGHRGPAEADLGVPRWSEDPSGLFAAIANYLRVTEPGQAPDVRFARAAAAGEAALDELATRVRRRRPVRGRLAIFLLRRARALSGLREYGKFAGLYRLSSVRDQLLLIGSDLVENGALASPGDIMFLTLDEAEAAVRTGADQRDLVAARRATHLAESRRRHVPVALLSDGTDVEALLPAAGDGDGWRGVGASPGTVTGRARVVHDPATARLDPGDILVVATTDPAWTPLFLTAGGLVSETGAVMAHGPTVAREYGLPAVISVRDATILIEDGQQITVDGAAGTVRGAAP